MHRKHMVVSLSDCVTTVTASGARHVQGHLGRAQSGNSQFEIEGTSIKQFQW